MARTDVPTPGVVVRANRVMVQKYEARFHINIFIKGPCALSFSVVVILLCLHLPVLLVWFDL